MVKQAHKRTSTPSSVTSKDDKDATNLRKKYEKIKVQIKDQVNKFPHLENELKSLRREITKLGEEIHNDVEHSSDGDEMFQDALTSLDSSLPDSTCETATSNCCEQILRPSEEKSEAAGSTMNMTSRGNYLIPDSTSGIKITQQGELKKSNLAKKLSDVLNNSLENQTNASSFDLSGTSKTSDIYYTASEGDRSKSIGIFSSPCDSSLRASISSTEADTTQNQQSDVSNDESDEMDLTELKENNVDRKYQLPESSAAPKVVQESYNPIVEDSIKLSIHSGIPRNFALLSEVRVSLERLNLNRFERVQNSFVIVDRASTSDKESNAKRIKGYSEFNEEALAKKKKRKPIWFSASLSDSSFREVEPVQSKSRSLSESSSDTEVILSSQSFFNMDAPVTPKLGERINEVSPLRLYFLLSLPGPKNVKHIVGQSTKVDSKDKSSFSNQEISQENKNRKKPSSAKKTLKKKVDLKKSKRKTPLKIKFKQFGNIISKLSSSRMSQDKDNVLSDAEDFEIEPLARKLKKDETVAKITSKDELVPKATFHTFNSAAYCHKTVGGQSYKRAHTSNSAVKANIKNHKNAASTASAPRAKKLKMDVSASTPSFTATTEKADLTQAFSRTETKHGTSKAALSREPFLATFLVPTNLLMPDGISAEMLKKIKQRCVVELKRNGALDQLANAAKSKSNSAY